MDNGKRWSILVLKKKKKKKIQSHGFGSFTPTSLRRDLRRFRSSSFIPRCSYQVWIQRCCFVKFEVCIRAEAKESRILLSLERAL